ncbi:MAG: ABC transporter substrate-binding protein [Candidatus Lustribacter sp.]|jgi:ABC-type nitrate/sulfonate/bicarbonate transport system substrate-binding protein
MFLRVFTAAVIGLAAVAPALVRAADEPLTLRVAATANDTYAEAYYAQERGDFLKAGLNVQVMTFTNGASVAQAVVSGAADIGISNVVQIATAVEKGIPIRYFAGGGLYSTDEPTSALDVAQNSPIRTAKDFEGQTIGVSTLKDTSAIATEAWLVANGADLNKIHFVEMPFAAMGPALVRGTVAGAVISEPSLSAARTGGARVFAKSYDGIAGHFMISGWFATQDFERANATAVKRFAQVIYATARWANTHRADSAKILVKYAQLDPTVVRDMTRCEYMDNLDLKMIQPALDVAAHYGALDRPIAAADIIDAI